MPLIVEKKKDPNGEKKGGRTTVPKRLEGLMSNLVWSAEAEIGSEQAFSRLKYELFQKETGRRKRGKGTPSKKNQILEQKHCWSR